MRHIDEDHNYVRTYPLRSQAAVFGVARGSMISNDSMQDEDDIVIDVRFPLSRSLYFAYSLADLLVRRQAGQLCRAGT